METGTLTPLPVGIYIHMTFMNLEAPVNIMNTHSLLIQQFYVGGLIIFETLTHTQICVGTRSHSTVLFVLAEDLKLPKCLPTGNRINKLWCTVIALHLTPRTPETYQWVQIPGLPLTSGASVSSSVKGM